MHSPSTMRSFGQSLPEDLRTQLTEAGTVIPGRIGESLLSPGQPVEYAYFPVTAVLSMVTPAREDLAVEAAIIGCEGMGPLELINGVASATVALTVQVPGDLLRLPREIVQQLVAENADLRLKLQHFGQALFFLAAQTSACNRAHSVVQRCARWLLLTHDRLPGDDFALTHLHFSQMLGIRRSSVTVAAEHFRAQGLISYTRGRVRIIDRQRLLEQSCRCCSDIRNMYGRLLGTPPPAVFSGALPA